MKIADSSPWLSAKNCQDGDIITFLNEGEWKESTKFTYDDGNPVRQLVFKVDHNGEEKQLSIIKPSRLALIEAYGDDTVEWVGKKCKVNLALNTKGGKSIILTPCPTPEKTEEQTDEQAEDDALREASQGSPDNEVY